MLVHLLFIAHSACSLIVIACFPSFVSYENLKKGGLRSHMLALASPGLFLDFGIVLSGGRAEGSVSFSIVRTTVPIMLGSRECSDR